MAEMKTVINYRESAETLKKLLGLKGSPVAVRFANKKEAIPPGIPEISEKMRHCMMVSAARKEGKIFYATSAGHTCNGGAWALGLREITESLKSGEFYFKNLGKFESTASCKRIIDKLPHLESGSTYATMYAPLEKTPFDPHVVIIESSPLVMLKLAQSAIFRIGGRIHPEFSGIQSLCSDTCVQPLLTGEPNYSLGCDGSRYFAKIDDNEMVMGFPIELLPEIITGLKVVTAASGSVKPV
ncbi:DUF169 domain-containing protein [uncultured Methanoregula sp.]|uniref:DUF169 domain-containing protein n=1 Tax=uncultured Methanoregula sp. TaxID=1005933 RepID=UPI002AAA909C|nr:DUF169 domain-containing protein [uncultured Methanoregula sp.]